MPLDRAKMAAIYQGDGRAASFPFDFKVFELSDIAA